MSDLLLHTARVNATERTRFYDEREPCDGTIFEDVPADELRGVLYRFGVEEFGRCVGKMYVDTRVRTNDEGGERWETRHVGYVFLKRERYDREDRTYLCETWLSLERVVEPARPTIVESVAL